jgi:hypothetical protein
MRNLPDKHGTENQDKIDPVKIAQGDEAKTHECLPNTSFYLHCNFPHSIVELNARRFSVLACFYT